MTHVYEAAQAMATYTLQPGTGGLAGDAGPSLDSLSVGDSAVPGVVGGALIGAIALIVAGGALVTIRRRSRTTA